MLYYVCEPLNEKPVSKCKRNKSEPHRIKWSFFKIHNSIFDSSGAHEGTNLKLEVTEKNKYNNNANRLLRWRKKIYFCMQLNLLMNNCNLNEAILSTEKEQKYKLVKLESGLRMSATLKRPFSHFWSPSLEDRLTVFASFFLQPHSLYLWCSLYFWLCKHLSTAKQTGGYQILYVYLIILISAAYNFRTI